MKDIAAHLTPFLVTASMAGAEPLFGIWQTSARDDGSYGHVAFSNCDGGICGVLVKSFDGSGTKIATPIDGRRIIWDMKADKANSYSGGKVWSPDADKTYIAKLSIKGEKLTVKGCILPICVTAGVWTRISD